MRIIAGEFKGRIIKIPKSKLVRPTTDKNKEAIFNYLNNYIDFIGITACDIYAGSGSLGLETLSRSANEVHFVEQNYAIYKNLLDNIELLKVKERTKVFKMPAVKFSTINNKTKYDLILADPPFFKDDIYKVFENIKKNELLNDEGILIIERSIQTEKEDVKNFNMEPIKRLGDSLIYQYLNS
ncbi:MAG: 16S rRNA (guanine(966)-N(2))-methyltransferase RsmD [Ignavibacteriae bacterium]|nr:MAG: 16S rRNA (guanine(966)-N(2))-methyltransferase RsmD [Ignavibacteriota bacterium]